MKSTLASYEFFRFLGVKSGLPSLGFPSGNNTLFTPADQKNLDSGSFHTLVYQFLGCKYSYFGPRSHVDLRLDR